MKTKLILIGLITLTCVFTINAQNASSNGNNASINGVDCCAYGFAALSSNQAGGTDNTALGFNALNSNTTGDRNTAAGHEALLNNLADENTAIGMHCMMQNTTGVQNTAIGLDALMNNNTGDLNTAMGHNAGNMNTINDNNTAFGQNANWTGGTDQNQTAIGAGAVCHQSDMVCLGDNNIISLFTNTGFYTPSDGRFKYNVRQDDVKGIEFIKRLRPVIFNLNTRKQTEFITQNFPEEKRVAYLNKDFNSSTQIRRSGFIAQEVEQAALETGYNFDAIQKPQNPYSTYALGYDLFVVPLVKAVQEQQAMLESYKQHIDRQNQAINNLHGKEGEIDMNQPFVGEYNITAYKSNSGGETIVIFDLPANRSNAFLTVYDFSGKQINSFSLEKNSNSISIGKLKAAIYICAIIADGEIMGTQYLPVGEK